MRAIIKELIPNLWHYCRVIGMAGNKFYWDDCFSRASSLAYTTLFALVPIAAISFSLFSAFGVNDAEIESNVQRLLGQILPPNENELLINLKMQVYEYLSHFGSTVRSLGAVSIGVLIFTGIALLNTIESALNAVWRVTSELSVFSKITNFWAVITGGPLLFIFSVYWYTNVGYVEAQTIPWIGRFVPLDGSTHPDCGYLVCSHPDVLQAACDSGLH